jgi:formylglycine-generating enzyme required for sulfatase activity/serine/threonine protein kinase
MKTLQVNYLPLPMSEEYRNALPKGTTIDTYRIESVLGEGGFGITYLVRELNLEKLFAMKELLPDGIAMRRTGDTSYVESKSQSAEGDFAATRKYFISEARILAKMNHPAVVGVQRLMEANGTCYMVMDYVEGDTLGDHLKKRGGVLSGADEFKQIFYPLMSGLEILHDQGIIHRDIKPGNIMVKPDGSPILLDFGAATQVQAKTMTITQMLSAGYSPFEQYTSRAKQGPYTDIYALGATMLKCITGKKPDDASDRMHEDRHQPLCDNETYVAAYGKPMLAAVDASLRMNAKERPQTVAEWHQMMIQPEEARSEMPPRDTIDKQVDRAEIQGSVMTRNAETGSVSDSPPAQTEQRKKNNFKLMGFLTAGLILFVFGLIMLSVLGGDERRNQKSAVAENAGPVVEPKAGDREEFKIYSELKVELRWCPPTGEGGFMMGSPTTEADRGDDEQQHKVVLSKGFWMMETEVTQGLWQAVMGENPSSFKKGDNYPVENVSWEDCQEFISRVNARGNLPKGLKAALPTEAQWEYACRAGTRGAYAGDLASMGWYEINSGGTTHPVGQKQANAWGLYDMHGNLWEWCADWYDNGYYDTAVADRDPKGPGAFSQDRVLRGGGCNAAAWCCRSTFRDRSEPSLRHFSRGFRLSLQVEAQ